MAYVSLENLFKEDLENPDKEKACLYKVVLSAALRANELVRGATPMETAESNKVATIALKEVAAGKVRYIDGKGKKS